MVSVDPIPIVVFYLTISSTLNAFQLREIHNIKMDVQKVKN